jgi:hypothetical protein
MSPSKVNNSTIKNFNNTEVEEMSKHELKRKMIRMNNTEEGMYKHINEF